MRVLCLEGGGFKGAFQVPIVQALALDDIDLVLGTSTGSLQGAMFAMGRAGELTSATLWGGIDGLDGFLTLNPFKGAGKGGVYSTAPLRTKVKEHVSGKSAFKIPYGCGIVTRETGDYQAYLASAGTDEDLRNAIVASCSVSAVMTPVRASLPRGAPVLTHCDGGHVHPLPLPEDIPGDPYRGKITEAIAILCNPIDVDAHARPTCKVDGLLDSAVWAAEVALHQGHRWAVNRLREMAEDGVEVTVYAPRKPLGGMLDAKKEDIAKRMDEGTYALAHPIHIRRSS